ncbi:methionyl-tRNA formyltransferase [Patescibacteria group bacterium]|nr:methionyl-tRNA formyltransferase [Patescibacteria group bacterium]
MKVVFFGSSRYVSPLLNMLHNSVDLPLVVTTEQGSQEPVTFFCKAKKINYISVQKSAEMIGNLEIQSTGATLGVVADFGVIIPQEVIDFFEKGIINVHPSLLPKYRGPTPAQSAILNGEETTGVSIIEIDKYMDHGPIIAQAEAKIDPNDTARSLYEKLFKLGTPLLQEVVNQYEAGIVKKTPQDHTQATFTKLLTRDDGFLELSFIVSDSDFLNKMVRAYYPWPGVWTRSKLNEEDEKIIKFMPEKQIQVEGKRETGYKDFINGYPNADITLLDFLRKEVNEKSG